MCCSRVYWVAAVRLGLSPCIAVSYATCPFSMRIVDARTMRSVMWHHLSLESGHLLWHDGGGIR